MSDVATPKTRRKPVQRIWRKTSVGGEGMLWGLHAVAAALANPQRTIVKVMLTRNAARKIGLDPETLCPPAMLVEPEQIAAILPDSAIHQGVCAQVLALESLSLEEAVAADTGPLLVLDGITDPQNIGAIFRSGAAFGVTAILMQTRKVPPLSGALAKAAAGAIEQVHEVRVVNIARALNGLSEAGWCVCGLAAEGDTALSQAVGHAEKLALVLGAEGKGLRPGVARACICLARIPVSDGMPSLNVSNAAAIALYEASRQFRLAPSAS